MKRYIFIILAVSSILPSLTLNIASAETSANTSASDTQSLDQRVKQRKTERGTKLNATQLKRLPTVCKAAQGKAAAALAKANELQKSRPEIYAKLNVHLSGLTTKLKTAGIDVTNLQTETTSLLGRTDGFKTNLSSYQQTLNDLVTMDCANDPVGFQASLDAARDQHDKLQQQSADIKSYVSETIKPTLKNLRQQLAKSEPVNQTEGKK